MRQIPAVAKLRLLSSFARSSNSSFGLLTSVFLRTKWTRFTVAFVLSKDCKILLPCGRKTGSQLRMGLVAPRESFW